MPLPEGMGFSEYLAMSSANGGLQLVMLLVGALAVLAIGSEYATGSIRTTMTAVPRRTPVMLAKAVVLSVVALLFGLLSAGLAMSPLIWVRSRSLTLVRRSASADWVAEPPVAIPIMRW